MRSRRIETWQTESEIVAREAALGIDTPNAPPMSPRGSTPNARASRDLTARWEAERALVARILAARRELDRGGRRVPSTRSPN